jgi:uncharacterized protein YkwD
MNLWKIALMAAGITFGNNLLISSQIFPIPSFLNSARLLAENDYQNELLSLTNTERKKVGLPPLRFSPQLSQAAQIHAEDMVKHQFFDHRGYDGSSPIDRAKKFGYPSSYIGENISAGQPNPVATIQGWMKNSQHRSNILNPEYTDVGFGYVNAPETEYRYYWVQVFGKISQKNSFPSPNSTSSESECQGQKLLSSFNCAGDTINSEEQELQRLINQYRAQYQLPYIPLSPSLSIVANRHLRDLQENAQFYSRTGQNWRFGWSNCPFDGKNPSTFNCMWTAPQRLKTAYPGKGYEMICGGLGKISAETALNCWRRSAANNEVILNQGSWLNYQWKAIGIALDKGYAVLWFGQEFDPIQDNNRPQNIPPSSQPPNTPNRTKPGKVW